MKASPPRPLPSKATMTRRAPRTALAAFLPIFLPCAAGAEPATRPVPVTVVTTLTTGSGQIRQFAFDGDPGTSFVSAENPTADDHFTLVFDRPVSLKSVAVLTGHHDGRDPLDAGALEVSADGKAFARLAGFDGGAARATPGGKEVQAVRVTGFAGAGRTRPLAIREFTVESDPPVPVFAYPVEFTVDVSDAPGMRGWAEEVARLCERWYPRLNEELKSDGYRPARRITMTLSRRYRGVAEADPGAGRILGSVRFFQAHPEDVGAMIHETTHVVQNYRGRNNPGWLVEGLDDYVRYYLFEPGRNRPVDPARARHDAGYGVSAAFLAYVINTYEKNLVSKLNTLMREGHYTDEVFRELTGKALPELDREWRDSLRR